LSAFRKYCNLLIRPSKTKRFWEHFEPCLQGPRVHKDWLWRIADHGGLRMKEFKNIHKTNRFKQGSQSNQETRFIIHRRSTNLLRLLATTHGAGR
jgi:hypothetical protein